jgi:hypothetical protein
MVLPQISNAPGLAPALVGKQSVLLVTYPDPRDWHALVAYLLKGKLN